MAVVEEWLSSTEPGLQIDSPFLPSIISVFNFERFLLLTKYFNFVEQLLAAPKKPFWACPLFPIYPHLTSLNCRSVRLFPAGLALTVGRLRFYSAHKW